MMRLVFGGGIVVGYVLATLAWAALYSIIDVNVTDVPKSSARLTPEPQVIAQTGKLEI